jgi:hypothetical protein
MRRQTTSARVHSFANWAGSPAFAGDDSGVFWRSQPQTVMPRGGGASSLCKQC